MTNGSTSPDDDCDDSADESVGSEEDIKSGTARQGTGISVDDQGLLIVAMAIPDSSKTGFSLRISEANQTGNPNLPASYQSGPDQPV